MVRVGLFYPENNTLDMTCDRCQPIHWISTHTYTCIKALYKYPTAWFICISLSMLVLYDVMASTESEFEINNRDINVALDFCFICAPGELS